MPREQRDTIAAIATPPGKGGIGVVRVSGPDTRRIASAVLRSDEPLQARRALYSAFFGAGGGKIDSGIALFFESPHSYTGEDVLELQGHGGPVVMQLLLVACVEAGARIAAPGEFTQRAFLEGKLDLAQAEAVADLIEAASEQAARSALRSLEGEFSAAVGGVARALTELRSLVEAMIDFPEEEVDELPRREALARLARLREGTAEVLSRSRQGKLLGSGIRVVLAGRPNVGKSSLLNRLLRTERAIVTAVPGTTRDALHETVSMQGVPVTLVDTAGLRDAADEVERIGIDRTWREVEAADVVLLLSDARMGVDREDTAVLGRLAGGVRCVRVYNKVDLVQGMRRGSGNGIWVSALTGEGLGMLERAILDAVGWQNTAEGVYLARERHVRALIDVSNRLDAAAQRSSEPELFAEELRLAQAALGRITGEVSADDLLGTIFSRFCIGK